jgi:hypothetical protein
MVVPCWHDRFVSDWELPQHCYGAVVGDFGGVRDKTVILFVVYRYESPSTGQFIVIDERVFDKNTSTEEIANGIDELEQWFSNLHEYPKQNTVPILDCPGQIQVDLFKLYGTELRIPIKGDFDAGNAMLHLLTLKGRILVHSRCKFTAMTLKTARFNDKRTDWLRSTVLGHCDALAALIYGIRSLSSCGDPNPPVVYDPQDYFVRDRKASGDEAFGALFEGKQL